MYVAVTGSGKARVFQFRKDTRIPGTNQKKIEVVATLGNYEKMMAEDPEIHEKLKAEAKLFTQQEREANAPITVAVENQVINAPEQAAKSYHFGHAPLLAIWQAMGLEACIKQHAGKRNHASISQAIYGLLVHRLCDPRSVSASVEDLTGYAGMSEVGLDVHYQALEVLAACQEPLLDHLNKFFRKKTHRTGPMAYYDVTTHSFESVRQGELRMFGFSKNHKNNEVQVVMGLLIDNNGIPISYTLFPGNTMDQKTLQTAVRELKVRYGLDKIVIVADRGLNGKENLEYLLQEGHDFVFAYTLKRSTDELKAMALAEDGWTKHRYENTGETDVLSWKGKMLDHQLSVKIPLSEEEQLALPKRRGRPQKYRTTEIPVKIHLTWSRRRAEKDLADRERMLTGLKKVLARPSGLTQSLKRGRNQYIAVDMDTENAHLDEDKILEQAQFDGYYAIITNDVTYTTSDVEELYGGLWEIEESFRIMKTDLQASPVFVWKDERIAGHFMLCYLALTFVRYAQYLLREKKGITHSAAVLMNSWYQPKVVALGTYPSTKLIPTSVPQAYFDLAECLNLRPLRTCMAMSQFKTATKLDISHNLQRDNRTVEKGS